MMRTKFVLLAFSFFLVLTVSTNAQHTDNVTIRIAVVDGSLNVKSVPKFLLSIAKRGEAHAEWKIATGFDGVAKLTLPPGDYFVRSMSALSFEGKSYTWEYSFKVTAGRTATVELSNDNAKVSADAAAPKRRVSEAAELFKTLRNGVV